MKKRQASTVHRTAKSPSRATVSRFCFPTEPDYLAAEGNCHPGYNDYHAGYNDYHPGLDDYYPNYNDYYTDQHKHD